MRFDVDWSDVSVDENVLNLAWVKMGDHDREVLVGNHPELDGCTQWLVMEHPDSLVLIPCAEDMSSEFDHPFEEFFNEDGKIPFEGTVEQLGNDEYYEDYE